MPGSRFTAVAPSVDLSIYQRPAKRANERRSVGIGSRGTHSVTLLPTSGTNLHYVGPVLFEPFVNEGFTGIGTGMRRMP